MFGQLMVEELKSNNCVLAAILFLFVCGYPSSSNYHILEYATVNEMLAVFRGNCSFRVYMPSRPAKYGIKIFILADTKTFYMLHMEVYLVKQPKGPFVVDNSGAAVVKRLVSHIIGLEEILQ